MRASVCASSIAFAIVALFCLSGATNHVTASIVSPSGNDGKHSAALFNMIGAYEVVKPQTLHLSSLPPTQTSDVDKAVRFDAYGKSFTLLLKRSDDLFAAGYEEWKIDQNGDVIEQKSANELSLDCYFSGHLADDESAVVTLSTCNSARDGTPAFDGSISASGEQFYIQSAKPFQHKLQSYSNGDHLVFRSQDLKEQGPATCGVGDDEEDAHDHVDISPSLDGVNDEHESHAGHLHQINPTLHSVEQAAPQSPTSGPERKLLALKGNKQKYIEVLVVNDYERWNQFGDDTVELSKQIFNGVRTLWSNQYTSTWQYDYDVRITGMVTMAYGDAYPPPTFTNSEAEVSPLLGTFRKWAFNTYKKLPTFDVIHLLSGYEFAGSIVGLAQVGVMCSKISANNFAASMSQANLRTPLAGPAAPVAAHEIGHVLGMSHDNVAASSAKVPPMPTSSYPSTSCSSGGTVMNTGVSATASVWTNCSRLYVDYWMSKSYATSARPSCMDNIPSKIWNDQESKCGDGIIQAGEQCDCGFDDCAKVDPCCNQATCMLKSGAKCSATEPCCQSCGIVKDGRMCRAAASSDCDKAEYCDGKSGACPNDVWINHGGTCTWSAFNATGSRTISDRGVCYAGECYGHKKSCTIATGEATSKGLTGFPCSNRGDTNGNNACGMLYCSGPLGCYSNLSPVGLRWVLDGTPCGTGKQCYNGSCQASSNLPSTAPVKPRYSNTAGAAAQSSTGVARPSSSSSTGVRKSSSSSSSTGIRKSSSSSSTGVRKSSSSSSTGIRKISSSSTGGRVSSSTGVRKSSSSSTATGVRKSSSSTGGRVSSSTGVAKPISSTGVKKSSSSSSSTGGRRSSTGRHRPRKDGETGGVEEDEVSEEVGSTADFNAHRSSAHAIATTAAAATATVLSFIAAIVIAL